MISGQQQQYKHQHDETRQLFEHSKSSTKSAYEVFCQAAEQQAVKDLEQQLNKLELEKTQSLESAEKAKKEGDDLRTRLHWVKR